MTQPNSRSPGTRADDLGMIAQIRDVSRAIVREWGFMGGDFAGTDLSPSTVHALIEIDKGEVTARELGTRLRLEKSSVSRLLRKLVDSGDVLETPSTDDARSKMLSLSPQGRRQVEAVHDFANAQVAGALKRLLPGQDRTVLDGLRLYTRALQGAETVKLPVDIAQGYRPGIIASVTQMHAHYYAREAGLGQRFESLVASGLADLCDRLDRPQNAIWAALRGDEIVGSISMDGDTMREGIAHLRFFIVGDNARGTGAGRALLSTAIDFADDRGFTETHLSTFKGLSAARHLYESFGFICIEERPGQQWGKEVMEQRFVRKAPGNIGEARAIRDDGAPVI
jgi:DNA-binding MarR family transcriptional regulator/GNAT superfamily N-acetyltransferase